MSLVATLMQPLRKQYRDGGQDKLEQRRSSYGAWEFYQQQSRGAGSIIDDDLRTIIKQSMGKTIQIPVFDTQDVVITNTRSCTVPDKENNSALVTLTFVTYSFGFTMIPASYWNNDVKYQRDFNRKLEQYLQKLAVTLDQAAVNNLSLNKNTYWPADISAYYPVVGNALQITQAQKNDAYNQFGAIMHTMDFNTSNHVVATQSTRPLLARLQAQGAGNAVNENFQFLGYDWWYTNRMTNGAGVNATGYLVQDRVVAVENRNDPDAIMGSRVGNGLKIWDEVDMPLVNLRMASYYYEDCADYSAMANQSHLTRTKVEGYEWSTDICFVNTYNSNAAARFNPIVKFEISAS